MVLLVVSITFTAGERSEIFRDEVLREELVLARFLDGDYFQLTGIGHDVTESLKSAVRYSITLSPMFFM